MLHVHHDIDVVKQHPAVLSVTLPTTGTQPFTLDVVYNGSMEKHPHDGTPKIGFSAKGSVKRSEWGMDFAIPALDDAVEVIVETEFMPAPK